VRFLETPEPDYVGIHSNNLPYSESTVEQLPDRQEIIEMVNLNRVIRYFDSAKI
jgi:hypothetical protein